LVTEPTALAGVEAWSIESVSHRGGIHRAAFSADGILLATLGDDFTIRLWETATGALRHALPAMDAMTRAFAFSPDGARIATAGSDGLRIYEVASARWHELHKHRPFHARALAWSPDGRTLAAIVSRARSTAEASCNLMMFDAVSGAALPALWQGDFDPHVAPTVCWSSDGLQISLAPTREGAVVVDAGGGDVRDTFKNKNCRGTVWGDDGKLLIAVQAGADAGQTIELWRGGELRHTLSAESGVTFQAFSPDGRTLAATANDGGTCLWDTTTGERLPAPHAWPVKNDHPLDGLTVSDDRRLLARFGRLSGDFTLAKAGVERPIVQRRGEMPVSREPIAQPLAWSRDGGTLAIRSSVNDIFLWDPSKLSVREVRSSPLGTFTHMAWTIDDVLLTAQLSDRNARVAVGDAAPLEVVLDAADAAEVRPAVAISPDGRWLAHATGRRIDVYSTSDATRRNTLSVDTVPGSAIAWSPDGDRLAVVSDCTSIVDAATGEFLQTLPERGLPIWSPAGRLLLLWNATPEKFLVYDAMTGSRVVQLDNHVPEASPWSTPAWSPDGTRIAGRGRLWEVRTGRAISRLPHFGTHSDSGAPAWSPDSRRLAYATAERTITVVHSGYCRIEAVLVLLASGGAIAVNPHGHFRGGTPSEADLVYLVGVKELQRVLLPPQFAEEYRWKNDPAQVVLPDDLE
jgi:WD40 repeat protein